MSSSPMSSSPPSAAFPSLATHELAALAATWARTTFISLYLLQAGRFVWANDHCCDMLGRPLAELVGTPAQRLVYPVDWADVRTHGRAMLAGVHTAPYAYRYVTTTGAVRWALETVAPVTYRGQRAVLGTFLDITAHKALEAQLAHQAFHDALTALPNRALLLERLGRALGRPGGDGHLVAVLYLDLDDFKVVNDAYGHHTGDALLCVVAGRLQTAVRPQDTVGRLGGDEFLIILDPVGAPTEALQVAERVRATLAAPVVLGGHRLVVSVSIGLALSPPQAVAPDHLVRHADAALYHAKSQGKAQLVTAPALAVGCAAA